LAQATAGQTPSAEECTSGVNAPGHAEKAGNSQGSQSFLQDTEIDAWYPQQARERDRQKRETLLHKMQQKIYDEARFMLIRDLILSAHAGPRVTVTSLGAIPFLAYTGHYEDLCLKA